jgi:hypothetical protein
MLSSRRPVSPTVGNTHPVPPDVLRPNSFHDVSCLRQGPFLRTGYIPEKASRCVLGNIFEIGNAPPGIRHHAFIYR